MIRRNSSETEHPIFTEGVNAFVPASWKLWALIFRSIASGHYDELNLPLEVGSVPLVKDFSFKSSIEQLYLETCCWVSSELPSGFRSLSLSDRLEVFHAIKEVARDIVDSYSEAKKVLPKECPEKEYFEIIKKNCDVILTLEDWEISQVIDAEPSPMTENEIISILKNHDRELETRDWEAEQVLDHESPYEISEDYRYFNSIDVESWHGKVKGVLIEDIDCNTFRHVLNCDRYATVHDCENDSLELEDYSNEKITPLAGLGMAMYAFILILIDHRHADDEPIVSDGEIYYPEPWESLFESRIDWRKNKYNLEEDSWERAYLAEKPQGDEKQDSSEADPSECDVDQKTKNQLSELCGRGVFREVCSSDSYYDIITSEGPFVVGYDVCHYLHDSTRKELEEVYKLLRKETDFLYDNIYSIAARFEDRYRAERKQETSKWMFKEKVKNNSHIHALYLSSYSIHPETIQRLLYERTGFAYDHLDNQPIIYREMVEGYIKECIVHNEKLKTELIRALSECSESVPSKTSVKKDPEVLKTCEELRSRGIIDEENNVLPKRKDGAYNKTTELTNYLVEHEKVLPSCGWEEFVSNSDKAHHSIKGVKLEGRNERGEYEKEEYLDKSGKLNDDYYRYCFKKHIRFIIKELSWTRYGGVFKLDKEYLTASNLHHYFTSNNDEGRRIIASLLKSYDKPARKK